MTVRISSVALARAASGHLAVLSAPEAVVSAPEAVVSAPEAVESAAEAVVSAAEAVVSAPEAGGGNEEELAETAAEELLETAADVQAAAPAPAAAVRTLQGHTGAVLSVHVSPDGQHVVSGSDDKTVRIWSMADGSAVRTLQGHTGMVHSVHVSPDGQHVVSGSVDKTVRISSVALARAASGHLPSSAAASSSTGVDADVVVKGERTREQRDTEGRKRAIDLDEPAARRQRREPRSLDDVDGLAELLRGLPEEVQSAAFAWCVEMDCISVGLIFEAEQEDAFVEALSLNPHGVVAMAIRKRLAKARGAT